MTMFQTDLITGNNGFENVTSEHIFGAPCIILTEIYVKLFHIYHHAGLEVLKAVALERSTGT
jgi:hypothetical protein